MNRPTDDKDFDEYLGRQTEVSQRYRGIESDDVPAHLDHAVLAQARAAVGSDEVSRVRRQRSKLMQWGVPTALAASALLVVSIVINSGTQHEIVPASAPQSAPMPAPAAPPAESPEHAAKATAESADAQADVIMIAPPRDAVTEFSPLGRQSIQPQRKREVAAPAASLPEPAAIQQAAPPPPVPAAAPPSPATVARADAEAELAASRAAAASAASNEAAKARRAEEEIVIVTGHRRQASVQESQAPIAVFSRSDLALNQPDMYRLTPDGWLERIRELRREGKTEEADKEWKAFVEAHPAHRVDENDLARGKP